MTYQPAYDLDAVRTVFPLAQRVTYLNHASISPLPQATQHAVEQITARLAENPAGVFAPGPDNIFVTSTLETAALLNAQPAEIVSITSTSTGLNFIAQAVDWQPGDNVVFCDVEFPSNVYPWMALERHGVECRLAPAVNGGAELEAFEALVDEHTRMIAVSAVQFFSGHRTDLVAFGTFCHERGILFVVDAIQAAGHMPIDVQACHIDVLASGGQKSLMGPPGQGILYVREDVANQLQPGVIGPNATAGWEHWLHYDLTPHPGAQRFMMGTPNVIGMFGLQASVRFLRGLGLENIDAWTRHLTQIAIDDLTARGWPVITPTDPARQGPIVTFRLAEDASPEANAAADNLVQHLLANNIIITKHLDAQGVPHLRISTHCYNTEDEVRRVGAALEEFKSHE